MAYAGKQPIGTMLIQAGKLDEDQLQTALREQQKKDGYIGQTFVELGFIEPKELTDILATNLRSHTCSLDISRSMILLWPFSLKV